MVNAVRVAVSVFVLALCAVVALAAQQGGRGGQAGQRGQGGQGAQPGQTGARGRVRVGTAGPQPGLGVYPQKPLADDATLERGKAIYAVNCQFCHGADVRGGDSGPSLLRSQIVLEDYDGEVIREVLQAGRPPVMPKFTLTAEQVADLAAYIHSFIVSSRDPIRRRPETIVTGDAAAGQVYFKATCATCHTGDRELTGIAARFADPKDLQQWWLMPGGGGRGTNQARNSRVPVTTATVTLSNGQSMRGRLTRLDEFIVSIEVDGATRTFRREGEVPRVEVHDPLDGHKALLRKYSDKDIHDVTAYLVTLR